MSLKIGNKTIKEIGHKINPQTVKKIDAIIHDARLIFNNEQAYASNKRLNIQWAYYTSVTLTYWVEDVATGDNISDLPVQLYRRDDSGWVLSREVTSPNNSQTFTVSSSKNYNIICLGDDTYPAVEAIGLLDER